jgi:PGF-pre-PGF domain-containing protein
MGRIKLFFSILLVFILALSIGYSTEVAVDSEVFELVEENAEVSVIVELEKSPEDLNFVERIQAADVDFEELGEDQYVVEISEEELDELLSDPNVVSVKEDEIFKLLLSQSLPLINGTYVQALQVNGINLTGKGRSVCVIDTGINSSHISLTGRVVAEKCFCDVTDSGLGGCCPDTTNEDTDATDDHGHGTHVAGIVASNKTAIGVAPEANIVAVKVTNSAGNALFSDIEQAVEWCVANAETYNMTVITISLGAGSYSANCDATYSSLAADITAAENKNVSVTVASGNDGYTANIAAPACISNTISVGMTYDANVGGVAWSSGCTDVTTATDQMACATNRNSLLDILAPGATIISTSWTGSTTSKSGTSMAAPHMAGIITILQQYEQEVEGKNLTVDTINSSIRNGVTVSDAGGSGLNFIRTDLLAALYSVDNIIPNIINPNTSSQNNYIYNNITFSVNATDALEISNVTIEANWTGTHTNYTMWSQGNDFYNYSIDNSSFSSGSTFRWRVHAADKAGNLNQSAWYNVTVLTGAPVITINSPADGLIRSNNSVIFNFSADEDVDASFDCALYINDEFNTTNGSVLDETSTYFQIGFADGNYEWLISCNDSESLVSNSTVRTLVVDSLVPAFSSESLSSSLELGSQQYYNLTVNDTHLSYANFSSESSNYTMSNSSSTFFYRNFYTTINGTNAYVVYGIDAAGNQNNTNSSFEVTDTVTGPRMVNLEYTSSLDQGNVQAFSAFLVDAYPISSAVLTIGSTNYSMTNNTYYNFSYNFTTANCGSVNYSVWSNNSQNVASVNTSSYTVTTCCGNSVCDSGESCSSCSGDCGACSSTSTTSSSGGGGGGGGGSSGGDSTIVTNIISDASPEEPIEFGIYNDNIPVTDVEIFVNQELTNVKVSVEVLDSKPSSVDTPVGIVSEYLEISLTNFDDSAVDSADISFYILDSWVGNNSIDLDTVLLQRYNNAWEELSTSHSSSDEDKHYFSADVTGFSYFVITGEVVSEGIVEEPEEIAHIFDEVTGDDVIEGAPEEEGFNWKSVIIGLSVLIVTLIGIFIYVKHNGEK